MSKKVFDVVLGCAAGISTSRRSAFPREGDHQIDPQTTCCDYYLGVS